MTTRIITILFTISMFNNGSRSSMVLISDCSKSSRASLALSRMADSKKVNCFISRGWCVTLTETHKWMKCKRICHCEIGVYIYTMAPSKYKHVKWEASTLFYPTTEPNSRASSLWPADFVAKTSTIRSNQPLPRQSSYIAQAIHIWTVSWTEPPAPSSWCLCCTPLSLASIVQSRKRHRIRFPWHRWKVRTMALGWSCIQHHGCCSGRPRWYWQTTEHARFLPIRALDAEIGSLLLESAWLFRCLSCLIDRILQFLPWLNLILWLQLSINMEIIWMQSI